MRSINRVSSTHSLPSEEKKSCTLPSIKNIRNARKIRKTVERDLGKVKNGPDQNENISLLRRFCMIFGGCCFK